jgi:hypothetical protein
VQAKLQEHLQQAMLGSELPTRRSLSDPQDPVVKEVVEQAKAKIYNARSTAEKIAAMEPLREVAGLPVVDFSVSMMSDPDPEVRVEALELLAGYPGREVFQVAVEAMNDSDGDVRAAAVSLLAHAKPPTPEEIVPPLQKAITDEYEPVRETAQEIVHELPFEQKVEVVEPALRSPEPETVMFATGELEAEANVDALEVLFEGLDNPDPKLKEEVNDTLWFLISQRFESTTSAREWWAVNKGKYDAELFPRED